MEKFEGKVIKLSSKSGVSKSTGNSWVAQEVTIEEVVDKYPQSLTASLFGEDNVNQANLRVGDVITAYLNFTSKDFNGRQINDIRIWKVEKSESVGTRPSGQSRQHPQDADPFAQQGKGDIPF